MKELLELQVAEARLGEVSCRLAELERMAADERRAAALAEARRKLEAVVRAVGKAERELQRTLDEKSAVEAKARAESDRLYSGEITHAKEVDAVRREVESLERRVARLGELAEEWRAKADDLRARAEKAGRIVASFEEKVAREAQEQEAESARLRAERDELTERVRRLRAAIDMATLATYDGLRQRFGGEVVVQLQGAACGGCFAELTRDDLGAIKEHAGRVPLCPYCGRILVPGER